MKTFLSALCLGLMVSAVQAQGLDAPGQRAYDTLAHVSDFAMGGVGVAGTRSQGETALRVLLGQKQAASTFQRLLGSATPEGKLYGLLGLSMVAPGQMAQAAKPYESSKTNVHTMAGCIRMAQPIGGVVRAIEKGRYRLYFARVEKKRTPAR